MTYKTISSVSPYFDDFDDSKAFYAMLFNPSRSVQARELTQVQTILQNQIKSLSNHLFKDNSIIVNANIEHSADKNVIQILDDVGNYPASQTLEASFVGKVITDGITTATVTHVDQLNFLIYFNYISGPGYSNTAVPLTGPLGTDTLLTVSNTKSFATTAQCDSGIVYTGGYFVIVNAQEVIVEPAVGSHQHIGFIRTESTVTINEDVSLGDPANGTNNASAPGSDRYKVDLILSSYKEGDTIPANFVEFLVIDDNQIIKSTTKVQYADILDLLARRTYDESGNYIIEDFDIVLEEHGTDASKLEVNMQPGKAYILGYEVDKDLSSVLELDKARETGATNADGVFSDWGQYVIIAQIDDISGTAVEFDMQTTGTATVPDFSAGVVVDVQDDVAGGGTLIGTTRTSVLKRVGPELRLYLADLDDVIGSISTAKSISTGSATDVWYANLHRPKGYTEVFGKATGPILEFSDYDSIQSLTDVTYKYAKTFKGIVAGAANELILTGTAFDSFGGTEDVISITERASGKTIYTGLTVVGPGTSSITITRPSAIFTIGNTFDVVVSITKTQLTPRSKTLVSDYEDTAVTVIATTDAATTIYTLEQEDIISIKKIYQTNNFIAGGADTSNNDPSRLTTYNAVQVYDVTDLFFEAGEFYNGQTDLYYGAGTLKGMTTAAMLGETSGVGNTTYIILYDYYIHSAPTLGKGFTPASYPSYDLIGNYQSASGSAIIDLTNSIDFRYKLTEIVNTPEYPYQGDQLQADVTYYLSRIDKVYLDKDGNFGIKKGISSVEPHAPTDVSNAITLYSISLPAYTYDRNKVFIKKIDHKRYTMRDIGDIDSRLSAIEEYTSLSLLEKSATDLSIQDVNGFDMFKAGIFADPMTSYQPHNIDDAEYDLVIDPELGFGRGPYEVDFIELSTIGAGASSNINVGENIATLSYTENSTPLASNTAVTDFINVNPLLFHQWNGTIKLTPSVDQWIDIVQLPTIVTELTVIPTRPDTRLIDTGWNGEFGWWRNRWFGNRRNTDVSINPIRVGGSGMNRGFLQPGIILPRRRIF